MKIVADAAIPHIEHYFAGLGDIQRLPAQDINPAAVRDAEVLIVRTATRVDRDLLAGSRVRAVATATSGTDHIDAASLEETGVGLISAAGCNARAVAEYVLSSLYVLAGRRGRDLASLRAGIIGCGHVGSTLLHFLRGCGVVCRVCDPPLQEAGEAGDFHGLQATLEADIVSLHVPLTRDGPYATQNLVDGDFLEQLGQGAILVNASRGGVVDEGALLQRLQAEPGLDCVLDVWRDEPVINTELLQVCALGTPHIAGYTLEAKVRASRMVYERVCSHLGLPLSGVDDPDLPRNDRPVVQIPESASGQEVVSMAVLSSYDVRDDHERLRPIVEVPGDRRAAWFDNLRRQYPLRREFSATRIAAPVSETACTVLGKLGFELDAGAAVS